MTVVRPRIRSDRWFGCCGRGRPGPGSARGAVTAEFAVALPAVLLLLALLLAGTAAGAAQLRLEEAALAGARALARGESPAAAEAMVKRLAGASATAAIVADGEWVNVTVADSVAGPLGSLVPWTLTARASARTETPGASGSAPPGPTALGGPTRDLIAGGSASQDVIAGGPASQDVIAGGSASQDVIAAGRPASRDPLAGEPPVRDLTADGPAQDLTAPAPPPQDAGRPMPLWLQQLSFTDMA